ncbi:putative reverse transcriptase domain-containing protein [Tanacetum coccineum]
MKNRGKWQRELTLAQEGAYALGVRCASLDSNVITGTFLLNNRYASILFDTGADRSFVSTTFSDLIDVTPRQGGNAKRNEKGYHHNTMASIQELLYEINGHGQAQQTREQNVSYDPQQ